MVTRNSAFVKGESIEEPSDESEIASQYDDDNVIIEKEEKIE